MRCAKINAITLHFSDEGPASGPALIFVNSLGTDFRIWDAVVPAFSGNWRVVRYDKRGHGLSDAPPSPYSIDDHVDDLAGLMDHLGIETAVLVGLSIGGLIVTGLAARHPARVRALVLCDTAHKIGTNEMWDARIDMIRNGGIGATTDMVMQRWFSPAFHANRKSELAICRNMLERQPVEGYVGCCMALRNADHTAIYQGLKMPVLLLVGSNDGSTPPELVRAAHALIAGSTFVVIDGPGHIPCVEAPQQTISCIAAFLDEKRLN